MAVSSGIRMWATYLLCIYLATTQFAHPAFLHMGFYHRLSYRVSWRFVGLLQRRTVMAIDIPINPTLLPCAMLPSSSMPSDKPPTGPLSPRFAPPRTTTTTDRAQHGVLTAPAQDRNGLLIPSCGDFLAPCQCHNLCHSSVFLTPGGFMLHQGDHQAKETPSRHVAFAQHLVPNLCQLGEAEGHPR